MSLAPACYHHSEAVHAVGSRPPISPVGGPLHPFEHGTKERSFVRRVGGEPTGRARLRYTAEGRKLSVTACFEFGPFRRSEARLDLAADGTLQSAQTRIWLSGVERSVEGRPSGDSELRLRIRGPGEGRVITVPWGRRSLLDLGHPLLWGPLILEAEARTSGAKAGGTGAFRVVRLSAYAPRAARVDHFQILERGADAVGRRVLVRTREGAVAVWMAAGQPIRIRFLEGNERIEWRESATEGGLRACPLSPDNE